MNDLVTTESTSAKNELSPIDDLHSLNNFKQFQEEITTEILELDDFYGKIKKILLADLAEPDPSAPVRLGVKPPAKKSAMLIASQTSNLIAIKSLKLQFMKERTRIGEDELERRLKIIIASSKDKRDDGESGEFSGKNVLKYLISILGVSIPITGDTVSDNDILDGDFSDAELDRRLAEEDMDTPVILSNDRPQEDTLPPEEYEIDGENYKIILDEETLVFHLVDGDYNLIKELIIDEDIDIDIIDEENNVIVDRKSNTLVELV